MPEVKTVEVLSATLSHHPTVCADASKERWREVFSAYSAAARQHAAHLAAHSYDILLIGERVLLAQPSLYRSTEQVRGAHWLSDTPHDREKYEPASAALLNELYALRGRYQGHERLFEVPAPKLGLE